MLPLEQQNTMGIVAKTAADVPLIKKVPRSNFFPPGGWTQGPSLLSHFTSILQEFARSINLKIILMHTSEMTPHHYNCLISFFPLIYSLEYQ